MDARVLIASAAGAATLGVLGLAAVVLSGKGEQPVRVPEPPVLIGRATPPAALPPDKGPVVADAPPLAPPAPAPAPPPAPVPPPPAVKPPVVATLPPQPVAPKPRPAPRPAVVDHRYDGVLTVTEIARIRAALKLSPDQEPYWPPIAAVLRDIGRQQMAEVDAGQKPSFDLPGDLSSRLYSAVGPLLGTLREDQKEEVRRRAKMLGLDSVASFI